MKTSYLFIASTLASRVPINLNRDEKFLLWCVQCADLVRVSKVFPVGAAHVASDISQTWTAFLIKKGWGVQPSALNAQRALYGTSVDRRDSQAFHSARTSE